MSEQDPVARRAAPQTETKPKFPPAVMAVFIAVMVGILAALVWVTVDSANDGSKMKRTDPSNAAPSATSMAQMNYTNIDGIRDKLATDEKLACERWEPIVVEGQEPESAVCDDVTVTVTTDMAHIKELIAATQGNTGVRLFISGYNWMIVPQDVHVDLEAYRKVVGGQTHIGGSADVTPIKVTPKR